MAIGWLPQCKHHSLCQTRKMKVKTNPVCRIYLIKINTGGDYAGSGPKTTEVPTEASNNFTASEVYATKYIAS